MKVRAISAAVAVLTLIGLYLLFHANGLMAACALVTLVGIYEYSQLTFSITKTPPHLRGSFLILCSTVYFASVIAGSSAFVVIPLCSVVFFALVLISIKNLDQLGRALHIQMAGLTGFTYVGLFPALVTKTLLFEHGVAWFVGLLAIVFAGDTCAYLVGIRWGKNKLSETVSPKKTLEGAAGGLLGSCLGAAVMHFTVLNEVSLWAFLLLAVVTAVFAQIGDLFESLLKRVAEVKDSGTIMPGHGGFLDRADGVFFAAPVYYILVQLLTKQLG